MSASKGENESSSSLFGTVTVKILSERNVTKPDVASNTSEVCPVSLLVAGTHGKLVSRPRHQPTTAAIVTHMHTDPKPGREFTPWRRLVPELKLQVMKHTDFVHFGDDPWYETDEYICRMILSFHVEDFKPSIREVIASKFEAERRLYPHRHLITVQNKRLKEDLVWTAVYNRHCGCGMVNLDHYISCTASSHNDVGLLTYFRYLSSIAERCENIARSLVESYGIQDRGVYKNVLHLSAFLPSETWQGVPRNQTDIQRHMDCIASLTWNQRTDLLAFVHEVADAVARRLAKKDRSSWSVFDDWASTALSNAIRSRDIFDNVPWRAVPRKATRTELFDSGALSLWVRQLLLSLPFREWHNIFHHQEQFCAEFEPYQPFYALNHAFAIYYEATLNGDILTVRFPRWAINVGHSHWDCYTLFYHLCSWHPEEDSLQISEWSNFYVENYATWGVQFDMRTVRFDWTTDDDLGLELLFST